jgi:hypothetical protein
MRGSCQSGAQGQIHGAWTCPACPHPRLLLPILSANLDPTSVELSGQTRHNCCSNKVLRRENGLLGSFRHPALGGPRRDSARTLIGSFVAVPDFARAPIVCHIGMVGFVLYEGETFHCSIVCHFGGVGFVRAVFPSDRRCDRGRSARDDPCFLQCLYACTCDTAWSTIINECVLQLMVVGSRDALRPPLEPRKPGASFMGYYLGTIVPKMPSSELPKSLFPN